MKVDSLEVQLGFKLEDTKLKDFIKSLGELDMKSVASAFGLEKMYEMVQKIMEAAGKTALSLRQFSDETGMSTKELQQWSAFAATMGVSAEEVTGSAKHLQDAVTKLRLTGEGSGGWNLLNIDPNTAKDSFELFTMVGESLDKLDPSTRRAAAQQLGLSDSMIAVMINGYKQKDSLQKIIYILDEQTDAIMKSNSAWAMLKYEWNVLITDIGAKLAPTFEGIAKAFSTVVKWAHKFPIVQEVLIAIAQTIGTVTAALGAMGIAMAAVNTLTWASGLSIVLKIIGLVVAGLSLIIQNWKTISEFGGKIWDSVKGVGRSVFGSPTAVSNPSFAVPEIPPMPGNNRIVNNKITVNGANSSPEEIADRIGKWFERSVSDAEMQTGV